MDMFNSGRASVVAVERLGFEFGAGLGDFGEFVEELDFDPISEFSVGRVGSGSADGGMIDEFFLGVVAWEAGDDGDVAEGDGELVGDDAGDATVAVEERVDADETVVEMGKETTNFVDVGGFDEGNAVFEATGEGVEFVINFGATAGNVVEVFVPWRAEANVVAARS